MRRIGKVYCISVLFSLFGSLSINCFAQAHRAEVFIGDDKGVGNTGKLFSVSEGSNEIVLPTKDLAGGVHLLSVRVEDEKGQWTPTIIKVVYVYETVKDNDIEVEWFYDTDPGVGKGNRMAFQTGERAMLLPTSDLTVGSHILSIRAKDSKDSWSPAVTYPLYVAEPMENFVECEYFIDEDPGEGKASTFGLDENGMGTFVVPTSNLVAGTHYLTLRGLTDTAKWLPIHVAPFEVTPSSGINNVEWRMVFSVSREGSSVILKGKDIPSGSRVMAVSVSGLILHDGIWEDEGTPYTINIDESERNMVLTIISPEGVKTTKRVR